MITKIEALTKEVKDAKVSTKEQLEAFRIQYLSKKGLISGLMEEFRSIPSEQKREMGQKLNALKEFVAKRYEEMKESLDTVADTGLASIDLTRTATQFPVGSRHPISIN